MEFFIIRNDEQQGPFTLEQLSGMNIMPETPVWTEGMPEWTTADKVAELQPLVAYAPRLDGQAVPPVMPQGSAPQPPQWNNAPYQQAPYTATPQQPYSYEAPQQPQYAAPVAPKPKKSHTALWVTLAIVAVLAGVLAITNPDKKDHCDAISSVTTDWTQEKIGNVFGGFVGGVSKIVTKPLVSAAIESAVDVKPYGLFSIGYIGETKVSLGILGHVFTFNKSQIDEKIEEVIGVKTNDALDAIKGGISDIFSSNDEESTDNLKNEAPEANSESNDEEVTAEDRVESDFDMSEEVDTILKTITKEGAKAAGKAIDKAIDEMFN